MTAHVYWENVWRKATARVKWSRPDPWVAASLGPLRDRGVTDTLDIGCGIGRHTVLLANEGFCSHGLDKSRAAVAAVRQAASEANVRVSVTVGDMAALPYPSASFDFVLAYNVIYHCDEDGLRQALAEVRRVLRPRGIYQATMLSKRNREYGRGVEISPNTFCQPLADDDKVHPHLYTDAEDLIRLHNGFKLVSHVDAEQSAQGSFHWHCQFEVA